MKWKNYESKYDETKINNDVWIFCNDNYDETKINKANLNFSNDIIKFYCTQIMIVILIMFRIMNQVLKYNKAYLI